MRYAAKLAPAIILVLGIIAFPFQASSFWHGNAWTGFLSSCSSEASDGTVTQCPANVRFRDFSSAQPYSGNPLIPSNTAAYNVGGADTAYTDSSAIIGGVYYEMDSSNDGGSTPTCSGLTAGWNNLVVYKGSPLSWTAISGNPVHTGTASTWENCYVLHPSTFKCSIATWCAVYSASNTSSQEAIGLLTSPDFETWTPYSGNPVVNIADKVALPSVITCGSQHVMFVADRTFGNNQIKYYTSPLTGVGADVTWILGGVSLPLSTHDWEFPNLASQHGIEDPHVIVNSHNFLEMAYTADLNIFSGFTQWTGYAVAGGSSVSGGCFNFQKYQTDAILKLNPGGGFPYSGNPTFFQDGTTFHFGYGASTNGAPFQVGDEYQMADH